MKHAPGLVGALAIACTVLPATAVTSTFNTSAEGWTAQGDFASPLTWVETAGNPGGHVTILDSVTGGVTYFVAPSMFLGNQTGAIGTNLTFDLQQVYSGAPNQFDAVDVILEGAGLTMAFDTLSNPPNGAWLSYSVPLAANGWRLNDLSGVAVTGAQFAAVMGNLTALKIRAEYQSGPDTGKLDNVTLVPEPATYAMLAVGLAAFSVSVAKRRRGSGAS